MKSSKLLALLIAFGVLFTASLQAQDDQGGGRRGKGGQGGRGMMSPEARVEQLDKALSLTAEQKTKITEIYKKAGEDMRAAMQEAKGDRDALRAKMMDMMKKTREDVRATLTDEQKTKFDAMPQRGAGDQGGRRGKRGNDNK
jgi:Spy/CpxP family protein refolding chaperone